jgi:ParB family transcriptional regulator, chromosome partitioning protein
VQIETSWRPPKEQRPGTLQKQEYRMLDVPDNPDAEPPCLHTKTALIVFGRGAGKTITVCVEEECPVHDPATAARLAKEQSENPEPVVAPAPEGESEEEAQARQAEYEQQRKEYEAEQERKAADRQAELERQQKEYEAEQKRREKHHKERIAGLERIIEQAPAVLDAVQLRLTLELLIHLSPYGLFEEAAEHFVGSNENHNKSEDEILSEALAACADHKLVAFFLRPLLTEPLGVSSEVPHIGTARQVSLMGSEEA